MALYYMQGEMEVLARLKHSCVKGYYVYKIGRPMQSFSCEKEAHNPHSEVAILVKTVDGSKISHVPDRLADVLV